MCTVDAHELFGVRHSTVGSRIQHVPEKFIGIHAMRRVMRAGVYATRFSVVGAQIAGRSLIPDNFSPAAGPIALGNAEWVKSDVAVRAIAGAQAATNTPVFDDHLKRLAPPDGAYRASDHAE